MQFFIPYEVTILTKQKRVYCFLPPATDIQSNKPLLPQHSKIVLKRYRIYRIVFAQHSLEFKRLWKLANVCTLTYWVKNHFV